jgi:Icc-related predicted phosphoesterase
VVRTLRILAVSDAVEPSLDSALLRERLGPLDLLVGCGDLPAAYLEGLVTRLNLPAIGVPGNHDPDAFDVPGMVNIDGLLLRVAGVAVLGLGGSRRYKSDGRHQYTEGEMGVRVAALLPLLLMRRVRYGRGVDLVVTHSPPRGVHDGRDLPHIGFAAFHRLLKAARPRLLLHGHTAFNRNLDTGESAVLSTRVINVNPFRIVELETES